MTHLEIQNLTSDYLEGLLEPSLRATVEAHLAECAACRELLAEVRHALELCRAAEEVEPTPWLISKIMRATVGERKPTWAERIAAYCRPVLQPRVAYSIAMTVFTFSILVNAAGLRLRSLRFEDLNPLTWLDRVDRQGHLMAARVEKFVYDVRLVYEIESRVGELGSQQKTRNEETPKPATEPGGSSQGTPTGQNMAFIGGTWAVTTRRSVGFRSETGTTIGFTGEGRSLIP